MPPEGIDSLNGDNLKGLVLSLLRRIDELFEQNNELSEQNKRLLEQISALLARIAELEGRAGKPPKTPSNSSLPPSSGQKANVADKSGRKKKCRKGRPGVARELCPNPDVTRDFFAERCDCGGKVPRTGQVLAHAYDHIEIPPIRPWTTRNNLYKGDCSYCGKTITATPPADMPPGSPFGPGIVALVTYLHGCQMVSYARLAEMLDGLFGLKISEGAIANMLSRAAAPFAECAEAIHEIVRNSPVIASDETSARVKGKTQWQWTFVAATHGFELAAINRNARLRKQTHPPAQLDEPRTNLLDGATIVLAEVSNRLVIRHHPTEQPHHLDIAPLRVPAAGSTAPGSSATLSASAKASITRTELLSSTQSSRLSGNSVDCARSAPATKRFINSPAES